MTAPPATAFEAARSFAATLLSDTDDPTPDSWPSDLLRPGGEISRTADEPLSGWRLFALRGTRLAAPWAVKGTGDPITFRHDRVLRNNPARCALGGRHPRAIDCACGLRVMDSIDSVRAYLGTGPALGESAHLAPPAVHDPVVLAQVEAYGWIASGRPVDDPPGTVRAEVLRLTGLMLRPDMEARSPGLSRRYRLQVTLTDALTLPTA